MDTYAVVDGIQLIGYCCFVVLASCIYQYQLEVLWWAAVDT